MAETPWYKTPWGTAGIGGGLTAILGLLGGRDAFGSPAEYTQTSTPVYRIGQDPYATALYEQVLATLSSPRTLSYGDFNVPYYDKTRLNAILGLLTSMLPVHQTSSTRTGGDSGWLSDALGTAASIYGVASQTDALRGALAALTGAKTAGTAAGAGAAAAGAGAAAGGAGTTGAQMTFGGAMPTTYGADAATTAAMGAALGPGALMGIAALPIALGASGVMDPIVEGIFGGGRMTPEEARQLIDATEAYYQRAPEGQAKEQAKLKFAKLGRGIYSLAGRDMNAYNQQYPWMEELRQTLYNLVAQNPNTTIHDYVYDPVSGQLVNWFQASGTYG